MSDSVESTGVGKPPVAALEGWFSMDAEAPRLLGSRCTGCGSYYFPKQRNFCRNPDCDGEHFEEVPLSRGGKLWSFTNACYAPPEPYVCSDPFQPFAIAAVELEAEKMIVLGQVAEGIGVGQLRVGMDMELVLETLFEDQDSRRLIWKWKPVAA